MNFTDELEECCDSVLEVIDVGSYQVSTAFSITDLSRIDSSVFSLSHDVAALLATNYPDNFGFIICQLKQGAQSYHPFAYSHFSFSDDGTRLFVPTRHYHPHSTKQSIWARVKEWVSNTADWDHKIYVFHLIIILIIRYSCLMFE